MCNFFDNAIKILCSRMFGKYIASIYSTMYYYVYNVQLVLLFFGQTWQASIIIRKFIGFCVYEGRVTKTYLYKYKI